jgi:acyl-ACP thioesterase
MLNFWEGSFPVHFSAIDKSDRLTLAAAFDYFQEAAINHAEHIGIGREAMAQAGQAWILSRMSVVFARRPAYREPIVVRSWAKGWEKLFALREYDIRDASGNIIVQGSSSWIILDIEKRRPLRPQSIMDALPLNKDLDGLLGGAVGIEAAKNLQKSGERRALYSDIDYNGHVNNIRYIEWIQDIADPELLENADKMRLDINYLGELKLGEVAELWTAPQEAASPALAFEGCREEQAVFRAKLLLS